MLVVDPNPEGGLRIGVSAGRSVGNAVLRNRAKRQLRAAIDGLLPTMVSGKDLIFLARSAILSASFADIQLALGRLLERAGLLRAEDDHD